MIDKMIPYFHVLISLITLGLIIKHFYASFMHPPTEDQLPHLKKPPAHLLKPWAKQEKKKPKVNDDDTAWMKEKNIEGRQNG